MERVYTIPLRRAYNAAHKYRARAAMKAIRAFVARHMHVKEEDVRIHPSVNEEVWRRGARKPPRRIRVRVEKRENVVWVYPVREGEKRAREDERKE